MINAVILPFHGFKLLPLMLMRFFTKNSGGNRFARRTISHVLPSFRSNYRDSAQTCPRRARFFARTLENEEPLTGAHIPTCRSWGWFSMDSRGEHRLYPRGERRKKSASRGEVMEPTYSSQKLFGWEQSRCSTARYSKHRGRWWESFERKIDTEVDSFVK